MHLVEGKIILKFLKFCLSMKSQNKEDIFTLEKVKGPLFFFVQEENIIYKYNANVLADFIEETGCYKDPQTQIIYNEIELKRLEKITNRSIRGIKKEKNTNDISSIIPFLENEVGENVRLLLEHNYQNNNSIILLNEKDEWFSLLQSLNEIKQIGLSSSQSLMKQTIDNLKHEEKRLIKQTRMCYVMLRYGKIYDYFIDDQGNITICYDDKQLIHKYYKVMDKFIVCKTLMKELTKQLFYQTRFQELMLRLNVLPTIHENSSLV